MIRRHDLDRIIHLRSEGRTWKEIGAILGTSGESCRKAYARAMEKVAPVVESAGEKLLSRSFESQYSSLLTAAAREKITIERLSELLKDVIPTLPTVPPPFAPSPSPTERRVEETMVLLLSDWHAYEQVYPEGALGLNEYNARVFSQRARAVVQRTVGIKTKLEASSWRFKELVCALNGDFVSGSIHDLEKHLDAPNIVLSVYWTAYVLAECLRELSSSFERITCHCTSGNHGRLPDAKTLNHKEPSRNWDTLVYLIARSLLRDEKRITFDIPNSYFARYEVEGWRFLQTHGHGIRSWSGIPWYGLQRMFTALRATLETPVDFFLISHFHQGLAFYSEGVFVNGSLIGTTEYTLSSFGKKSVPLQLLLSVHREWGVSHHWCVRADHSEDIEGYSVPTWT